MPREALNEQGVRASSWWALREIDHLFGHFSRYTRFVIYSKRSLVAVVLLLTLSLVIWPLATKDRSGIRLSFSEAASSKEKAASSPVMNNPEYRGVGSSGQQYKINGKTATQQTPTLILIEAVEAQMLKPDGKWFSLTSDRAEYQKAKNHIDLFGSVTVIDAKETSFTTSHATIETQTMHIYGHEEITGMSSVGNILASGFEIKDNGSHLRFVGGDKQLQVTIIRSKKKK